MGILFDEHLQEISYTYTALYNLIKFFQKLGIVTSFDLVIIGDKIAQNYITARRVYFESKRNENQNTI